MFSYSRFATSIRRAVGWRIDVTHRTARFLVLLAFTGFILPIALLWFTQPSTATVPLLQTNGNDVRINFQPDTAPVPAGYTKDIGESYTDARGYGWVREDSVGSSAYVPLSIVPNSRDRDVNPDQRLDTLLHMQYPPASTSTTAVKTPAAWEYRLSNGTYIVTVAVGDPTIGGDAESHVINVEGVRAINNFVPSGAAGASTRHSTATVTVQVSDGKLTVDARGGTNTKINFLTIATSNTAANRPSVTSSAPVNNATNVARNTSVSAEVRLPNVGFGVDARTLTAASVILTRTSDGSPVPATRNTSGGGDVIVLQPTVLLDANTRYTFNVTEGVTDLSGAAFTPYSSTFTTGSLPAPGSGSAISFEKVALGTAQGRSFTSITIGPDGRLYAGTIEGDIVRFVLNSDGTTGSPEVISSLRTANGGQRMVTGLAFDPGATAGNLVLWVSHSVFAYSDGPDWGGKITRLSGANLAAVQDYVINLPRSIRDHLTNSVAFGPDGALYAVQGSNSAMGEPDNAWGLRPERMLNAAVLRLNIAAVGSLPLDARTADGGGNYNPFAAGAPLTIYASGVRNAYDLVWHSNGQLYVPANGSAAGGNAPATPGTLPLVCQNRIDSPTRGAYNGPAVTGITNVDAAQSDFLFRVVAGGYYGHPNPQRCEWVLNGGNPTSGTNPAEVTQYPAGTQPDRNWRGFAYDFGKHYSPNGVIEYKSGAFGGALRGKLLVARYSAGDDIITLTPGDPNLDIINAETGTPGLTGFTDPLDLVEHTTTGRLYVTEHGAQRITLLRPVGSAPPPPAEQTPYKGAAFAVPGIIEAEDFDNGGQGVAYNDGDPTNNGGQHRQTGVDVEAASENAFNVGWINTGEWLEYTVNVATAGTYTLEARVASAVGGGSFHVKVGDVDRTGVLSVPNTGGWQAWQTVSRTVNLDAGQQVVQVYANSAGFNLNYLRFVSGGTTPPSPGGTGSGTILREFWTGIGGTAVATLTTSQAYQGAPSGTSQQSSFEAPSDWADNYGTRMRGYVHAPTTGAYTFWIASDDNSELYISTNDDPNNKRRIAGVSDWTNSRDYTKEIGQRSEAINLVAGQRYYIEALQKEGTGGDNLSVAWQIPGGTRQVIPGSYLSPATGGGTTPPPSSGGSGLRGEYFDNMDLTALRVTRTDAQVDFNWGIGSPDSAIGVDTYSVRWSGQVEPRYTQSYTFYTVTDDGVRLWINGQLLIDRWVNQGPTEWSGTITLTANQKYDVRMEYYENGGGAEARLLWSSASQGKQIIPQSQLYAAASGSGQARIAVENLDGVPFSDRLAFNRIGVRNTTEPHRVHNVAALRVRNLGGDPLRITSLSFVGPWELDSSPALPATIAAGSSLDIAIRYVADCCGVHNVTDGALTIASNDTGQPNTTVQLSGFWQNWPEGDNEPTVAEIIRVFGYSTQIVYPGQQLNGRGQVTTVGEEVISPYWQRADTSRPVSVRQLAGFHVYPESATINWYNKNTTVTTRIFTHSDQDSQSLLPLLEGSTNTPAAGTFTPGGSFGFNVASEWSDPNLTDQSDDRSVGCTGQCGHHVRFWPAKDREGRLIANTWLMVMNYGGGNYDYNDNVYLISNMRPEN